MKRWMHALAPLLFTASLAHAQAVVIGPDGRPAALELRTHRVEAEVRDEIAEVTVTHTFFNPGAATAEGTFLFPLPPGAQVSRFSMEVDGVEMAGELLSADEARRIYEDIVRRSLDPALLEMADYRTFRARLFPIPGGAARTITLRYDAALTREGNTVAFRYPLQGSLAARAAGGPPMPPVRRPRQDRPSAPEATPAHSLIRVTLDASTAVTNLYSPSHEIDVERKGEREAVVTLENAGGLDGRDFVLYFSLDPADLGATLFTHRPYRDRPGYFMLLLSPPFEASPADVRPKDVVFVLDTSGSMAGEKIAQAKDALTYALRRLGPRDRFGLVAFSSDAQAFRETLAAPDAAGDAVYFVDQLEARGGTNINDALLTALAMLEESPHGMIIFLTDGLPTSGEKNEGRIRTNVTEANRNAVRIFTFGVGYDVNTRLLDGLSAGTGAFADYISPDENIEERVSTFYEKVRYPVLTDLDVKLSGVDAYAFAPGRLPDLYRGGRLILTGRYRTPGEAALTLRGVLGDKRVKKRYVFDFPALARERDFVARLWATRRVGELLDEIRLHGENDELRDEVIALAKEHGLVTPYTSYLVREDETMAGATPPVRRSPDVIQYEAPMRADAALTRTSGRAAVEMSKTLRTMREADVAAAPEATGVTVVAGRTLRLTAGGAWIDDGFDAEKDAPVKLKFASDAYFAFLRRYPEARAFARLGDRVTFRFRDRFVQIGPDGATEMSDAALRARFG